MGNRSRSRCGGLALAALVVGVILGYVLAPAPDPAEREAPFAVSPSAAETETDAETHRWQRLQQEVARLERQLAEEESRRRELERRADELFELLQRVHQQLEQDR